MARGPIDYRIEVWCKHCGDKYPKTNVKLIPKFGYKCPDCGGRCRTKSHSTRVYIPVIRSKRIDVDIRELIGKPFNRLEYQKKYHEEHPEVKQRFYRLHPHYNRDYQRKYRIGQKYTTRVE